MALFKDTPMNDASKEGAKHILEAIFLLMKMSRNEEIRGF
jgi:hypothetical protein